MMTEDEFPLEEGRRKREISWAEFKRHLLLIHRNDPSIAATFVLSSVIFVSLIFYLAVFE